MAIFLHAIITPERSSRPLEQTDVFFTEPIFLIVHRVKASFKPYPLLQETVLPPPLLD